MMDITIIDYGMGNLGSIQNLIKKAGYYSEVTSEIDKISKASKIILPGVGSFDQAVKNLNYLNLNDIIKEKALSGTPLLGICLGMQLLANSSEEGILSGLCLVKGKVRKFSLSENLKIPHMGWNLVDYKRECLLFNNFEVFEEVRFYFVHSYHFVPEDSMNIVSKTNYGYNFASSVQAGNIYGVQFHPEKSHQFGIKLIKNFIELT
jgi:glutamine amidotransferase